MIMERSWRTPDVGTGSIAGGVGAKLQMSVDNPSHRRDACAREAQCAPELLLVNAQRQGVIGFRYTRVYIAQLLDNERSVDGSNSRYGAIAGPIDAEQLTNARVSTTKAGASH